MSIELIRQVGAGSDDCIRRLNTSYWSLTSAYVAAGWNGATNKQWGSGLRFTDITIPKDSTILTAYLTFKAHATREGTTVKTRISAEAVDDAVTFADDSAVFDARWANRTLAVDWDGIAAWTDNQPYDSIDIAAVIQAIVNRGGWASGQDIVIFWEDFEDRSDEVSWAYREADSFEEPTVPVPPKLTITYEEPAPPAKPPTFRLDPKPRTRTKF